MAVIQVPVSLSLYANRNRPIFTSCSMTTHWSRSTHRFCDRVKFSRLTTSEWMWRHECTSRLVCTCIASKWPCNWPVSMRGPTRFKVSSVATWISSTFKLVLETTLWLWSNQRSALDSMNAAAVYSVSKDWSSLSAWWPRKQRAVK